MSSRDQLDGKTLGVLLLALLWFRSRSHDLARAAELEPNLPDGSRLPGSGDLREVAPVLTALDPTGFPALFNQALQIVERATSSVEDLIRDWVNLSPDVPEVDDDYTPAAHLFAAQAALETDDGRRVYHYNVGNLTVNVGDYYRQPASDTSHRYGVFLYPLQGAVAMVSRIRRLWPDAYRTAYLGPEAAREYAAALKPTSGRQYYEATVDSYASGLRARAERFGWK